DVDLLDEPGREGNWLRSLHEAGDKLHGSLHALVLPAVDLRLVEATGPVEADAVLCVDPVPVSLVIPPGTGNDLYRRRHREQAGQLLDTLYRELPVSTRHHIELARPAGLVVLVRADALSLTEAEAKVLFLPPPDDPGHRALPLRTMAAVCTVASRMP